MIALILLSAIVLASLLVFWLIPWAVRRITRGTYTVRPLGLCCFGIMTLVGVLMAYFLVTKPDAHLSDIFHTDTLEKVGLFIILWLGSAFGVLVRTEQGKLKKIEQLYARALRENTPILWEELYSEWTDEESMAFLQKHPSHGKLVVDGLLRLITYVETHPGEEPLLPGEYYWAGYMCELGINGTPDVPQAKALYEKALQLSCTDTANRAEFEQYRDLARRRLDKLMGK